MSGVNIRYYFFMCKWLDETLLLLLFVLSRKIEIVQFASRTRQQFVRLLALVKWAASADRVDKCQVS